MATERYACSEHWQRFAYEIMVINGIEVNACHIVIGSERHSSCSLMHSEIDSEPLELLHLLRAGSLNELIVGGHLISKDAIEPEARLMGFLLHAVQHSAELDIPKTTRMLYASTQTTSFQAFVKQSSSPLIMNPEASELTKVNKKEGWPTKHRV